MPSPRNARHPCRHASAGVNSSYPETPGARISRTGAATGQPQPARRAADRRIRGRPTGSEPADGHSDPAKTGSRLRNPLAIFETRLRPRRRPPPGGLPYARRKPTPSRPPPLRSRNPGISAAMRPDTARSAAASPPAFSVFGRAQDTPPRHNRTYGMFLRPTFRIFIAVGNTCLTASDMRKSS